MGNVNLDASSLEPVSYSPTVTAKKFSLKDSFFSEKFFEYFQNKKETYFSQLNGYAFIITSLDAKGQPVEIARFNFPISPTNIQIDVVPASNVEVTMKGIVENHNAAPLRRISIRGTTGMIPAEKESTLPKSGPTDVLLGAAQQLFGNTFNQAIQVANNAKNVAQSAVNLFTNKALEAPINAKNTAIIGRTGYDAIHTLMAFFDGYLAAKKSKQYSNYRLSFLMGKDRIRYEVSLGPHRYRKNPGTLEYEYDIELIAYKRTELNVDLKTITPTVTQTQSGNKLAEALRMIRAARSTVIAAGNLPAAFRSDFDQSFLTPIREVLLLGSDVANTTLSFAEFPASLQSQWVSFLNSNQNIVNQMNQTFGRAGGAISRLFQSNSSDPASGGANNGTQSLGAQSGQNSSGNSGTDTAPARETSSPMEKLKQNPELYPDYFEQFEIDSLPLPPELQEQIDLEIQKVRQINTQDLINRRDAMANFTVTISEGLGGGNNTFNRINGLGPLKPSIKKLSTQDIALLSALNDAVQAMDTFIANFNTSRPDETNDYYKFYASYARANAISFEDANSKFYVPFPYGSSLQSLAGQYLGDSSRWQEIAAVNGLKAPYIDEIGTQILLIASGSGNQIIVSNSDNLYIGQTVTIGSNTTTPTARKITQINIISSISTIITLDGEPDLNKYKTQNSAYLKFFAPNTVNSLNMIAIPSQSQDNVPEFLRLSPTPENIDAVTLVALSDIALDSNGDFIINSVGDVELSTGVSNLVQAAKIKLLTNVGTIVSDPSFGNPISAGISKADIADGSAALQILNTIFADDPRFGGILAGNIAIKGSAAEIKLLLPVNGTGVNLPLVTDIPL